ncbi:class I SAM-dependent methyltransferase [Cohnella panacarvi]|uniref:class I SAM-dependent methyltransferase n=1 Tax=Cohnella panacarvi TaxID=400776 RepID=UPI000478A138|nr:class I SAM-dependent methyltransferase [Cohnella panacarvi]
MDNTQRFTDRVDTYVKYRPSYPEEAIDYLYDTVGLGADGEIADVGAGTGKFTRLLLERGSVVHAVEPNDAMRAAAEQALGGTPGFRAVPGSAENTLLPDGSVDHIVCAQAFHWFDREKAKAEFKRILKPGGKVALIWNSRLTHGTPFLEAYDKLLRTYGIDYEKVGHKNISEDGLAKFFQPAAMRVARFPSGQLLDFEALAGRMLSSSYVPQPGHPSYEPMIAGLRNIHDRCNDKGLVSFDYETEVFWGEL